MLKSNPLMTKSSRIWYWHFGLTTLLAMGGEISFPREYALAQIVPDATLGVERSVVTPNGGVDVISGGATRGANLFHSFEQFSVPTGGTAFFNNAASIQNIISRVTGGSVSNIDGLLKANGTANLFVINPSGIIFGPNASLNIGGSFLASTANAIGFGKQGFFSATNPESPSSLLTVNPSALLFNQIPTASIQNNSVAPSGLSPSSEATTGLRVPDGKSLLLVGGDINMDSGVLNAFGGRVELGGSSGAGTIGLNRDGNNLSLSFPDSVERSDVFLSNGAGVDVTAGDGGSIAVNARNLEMTGSSSLSTGIESGLGSSNSKAGNISVNATGAINLNNESSIANQVLAEANGQGGDVNISASTLQVEGGAQVGTATFGAGKGGNLTVNAQDVQLINRPSGLFASAQPNSLGDAGDLTIKTNTLLVKDGAQAGTTTFGDGKGGNLMVNAQNVQLINRNSGLLASAQPNSLGDAGDLTIKTNTLLVKDGAQVGTATFSAGKGGNLAVDAQNVQLINRNSGLFASAERNSTGDAGGLIIKTNTLRVQDGAQVSVVTSGKGKGGNLRVNAQDIQLIGISADGQATSGLFASAEPNSTGDAGDLTIKTNTLLVKDGAQVGAATFSAGKGGNLMVDAQNVQLIGVSPARKFATGLIAGTRGTGKAGNLTITTQQLLISNGALTTVESRGKGAAGNLDITASEVRLDKGNITAQTLSGNGGNLTLSIADLLLMRHGSQISTTAGTAQQPGDGGNITINAPNGFIVAGARENNDITANAFSGSGGRATINAAGIFGIAPLSRQELKRLRPDDLDPSKLPTNDITAISQTNPSLSGTIELNTPDVDPSRGLVNLPVVPVDTSFAQGCTAGGSQAQSSFIITGRGGLPSNPGDALSTDAVMVDLITLNPKVENRSSPTVSIQPTNPQPAPILPASGWVFNNGQVTLTALAPNAPASIGSNRVPCHGVQQ